MDASAATTGGESCSDRWREHARSAERRPESSAAQFVEFQAREAERLLQRLDLYASDHAVPQHWR